MNLNYKIGAELICIKQTSLGWDYDLRQGAVVKIINIEEKDSRPFVLQESGNNPRFNSTKNGLDSYFTPFNKLSETLYGE